MQEIDEYPEPTQADWEELVESSDKLPASAYLVILIEFCERFTYYGLSGPFQNYIQYPNPESYPAEQPGALGRGQQTATALTTFFTFFCYFTPIIAGVIADQYLGKYKTILYSSYIYFVGLLFLTFSSIPPVLSTSAAFPLFVISLILIGCGTGGIKSNVSPLVAEQYKSKKPYVKTLENGKRVIITPQATIQKIFLLFYWGINVGGLSAIATTSLEKFVGFWPAYLLPTLMFIIGICITLIGRNRYVQTPPRGSVFLETFKVISVAIRHGRRLEAAKPSELLKIDPTLAARATWDDVFVDEIRRTLRACIIFCWFPIFWLCYSQMTNNLISMTGTMQTGNVPNDILQNINPFALIICIPIMDQLVYPFFRRIKHPLRPIRRIYIGFFVAACAMAYAAGIQSYVYKQPPYFDHPEGRKNNVSVALAIPAFVLIAISEIFASVTGLEYAYKKAPQSMKSLVMSLFLFTNCCASILNFALVTVAKDPKLPWLYTGIAGTAFVCSILIWFLHRKRDESDVADDAIVRNTDEQLEYATRDDKQVPHIADLKAVTDEEAVRH
ncbi:PTR2-domain-containing protein [Hesseltinella vesiculosa]|uniref:PTR2-domain-containing protein n=1 Tax=Hesseltinella vesiculosa TaxID=101127 RepID=A0A1X2GS65_9FUNG|nr:PTR2-domain-containing protein [Hesseltinella vesiculosa]